MARKISQFTQKTSLNNDDLILVCSNEGANGVSQASSLSSVSNKVGQILNISDYLTKSNTCSAFNDLQIINTSNTSSLSLAASTADKNQIIPRALKH
jgi:hypothetical protein